MDGHKDVRWVNEIRHAYEDKLGELETANEVVESLLAHPGWQLVQGFIDSAERRDDRDQGKPLSHEQYAMAHGKRIGFRASREIASAFRAVYADMASKQRVTNERVAESTSRR